MRVAISAIALLACTSLASAADLGGPYEYEGSIKDGPIAAAPYNWTGLYFGGHVGWATGEWDGTLVHDRGNGPLDIWDNPNQSIDADGWLGGLQIGWNRQHGSFLWGVEVDGTWTDVSGSGSFNTTGNRYNWQIDQELDWFATVRGRLGFLVTPRLLIYGTGGVAFGETSANLVTSDISPPPGSVTARGNASETHIGWAAGAGGEFMLADNWTIRGEWLHVDLGKEDYHLKGTRTRDGKPHVTDSFPADLTFDVFRIGVNYKFGH